MVTRNSGDVVVMVGVSADGGDRLHTIPLLVQYPIQTGDSDWKLVDLINMAIITWDNEDGSKIHIEPLNQDKVPSLYHSDRTPAIVMLTTIFTVTIITIMMHTSPHQTLTNITYPSYQCHGHQHHHHLHHRNLTAFVAWGSSIGERT